MRSPAGANFQYEEDTLYPALIPFFGEKKIKERVEEHDETVFENIQESMQKAHEQNLTLTEYAETVRPSAEEIVAGV